MADKTASNDGSGDPSVHHSKPKTASAPSDITKFATTLGGAALGNMIVPGLGGALVGAFFGALIASKAAKDESDGD